MVSKGCACLRSDWYEAHGIMTEHCQVRIPPKHVNLKKKISVLRGIAGICPCYSCNTHHFKNVNFGKAS